MNEPRPHLSIGEVLSLLQDEFPDITISKIRFLESQGLLNPERTPSGYRKFYDHDVEQLRWVLRQQKENFLPLKVIKDRLAAGQLDGPASESGVLDLAPAEVTATASASTTPAAIAAPRSAAAPVSTPRTATGTPTGSISAGGTPAQRPSGQPAISATGRPAANGPQGGDAPAPRRDPAVVTTDARPTSDPNRSTGAPTESTSTSSGRARPEAALGSSASLTADELCAATGVSATLLAELERYGLVDGRALGTDTVYDDEAMVICRLAATMAGAGIEARHLRMFKVAAEREAGLYEQLALPMLRARRSDGRQEAVAQITALTGTAAELHAALLRRALRGTFGPL